tara:strand:- start:319 stop:852 length:534 start_codon:yes stop_codon:yes gene_type:complete
MADVLLLNADAQPLNISPLSIITWQMAIKAYFGDKVTILRSYEDKFIRSQRLAMQRPSVVIANRYIKKNPKVKFTRRNVYIRDNYTCQYCFTSFPYLQLTFDHVIPRAHGGTACWENVVTACKKCNGDKGSDLIMPKHMPQEPNYWALMSKIRKQEVYVPHESWLEYIPWAKLSKAA